MADRLGDSAPYSPPAATRDPRRPSSPCGRHDLTHSRFSQPDRRRCQPPGPPRNSATATNDATRLSTTNEPAQRYRSFCWAATWDVHASAASRPSSIPRTTRRSACWRPVISGPADATALPEGRRRVRGRATAWGAQRSGDVRRCRRDNGPRASDQRGLRFLQRSLAMKPARRRGQGVRDQRHRQAGSRTGWDIFGCCFDERQRQEPVLGRLAEELPPGLRELVVGRRIDRVLVSGAARERLDAFGDEVMGSVTADQVRAVGGPLLDALRAD